MYILLFLKYKLNKVNMETRFISKLLVDHGRSRRYRGEAPDLRSVSAFHRLITRLSFYVANLTHTILSCAWIWMEVLL